MELKMDCEKKQEADKGNPVQETGVKLADEAISDMCKPKEERHVLQTDVDAFIDECRKKGKDPLDVVRFMVKKDAELARKGGEVDAYRRELMKGVVKEICIETISSTIDIVGLDDLFADFVETAEDHGEDGSDGFMNSAVISRRGFILY